MKKLLQGYLLGCFALTGSYSIAANDLVKIDEGGLIATDITSPALENVDSLSDSIVRVLLIAEKETIVSSTLSARIVKLNGGLGQRFKTGDLLVAFDCSEALARVAMSKADLSSAIDQHEAKVKMQGLEQASDVEVSMAASAANKAKAQLSLNNAQALQCYVRAPWNGRIAKVHINNHMTASVGQALMDLVKDGPLKIKLNVPSRSLARLRKGSMFTVSIDETGESYQASVTGLNSRVDPVSQTVEIEAAFTERHKELLPGMSGISYLSSFN